MQGSYIFANSMLQVSHLFIYPIKSLGGMEVKESRLTDRGFAYDRRWMLVDEKNGFLTQREVAGMALLQVSIQPLHLHVRHKITSASFDVPLQPQTNEFITTKVWDDDCKVQFVSAAADDWFSEQLSIRCRLVYQPDNAERKVDPNYASKNEMTSLSDGYPLLMIGQASLDDLNSRLEESLPITRFRPNIVFTGGDAYQEDEMKHFIINSIDFYGVKPCGRCPITTINQETTERGKEPLKTLATYRRKNNKVYFGQNLLYKGRGMIRVGDAIEIVAMNDTPILFEEQ